LSEVDLESLASEAQTKLFLIGQSVVQQFDEGSSLFVVREGLLDVQVEVDGLVRTVGHLKPGSFFGEMSLLTGAPRSASVVTVTDCLVLEITKDTIEPLLAAREDLVTKISHVLALRQAVNQSKTSTKDTTEASQDNTKSASEYLSRIRSFFGFGQRASVTD
jgi:CRP-like cAMP-binding protein